MGIGLVLFVWAILGGIAAVGGAMVLVPFVGYLTRKASYPEQFTSRKLLLWVTAAFPFMCLGWGGTVFVAQAFVNSVFLSRDFGIGDGFDVPLPNGYELSFIDSVERGYLYDLRGGSIWNASFNQPGAIDDVAELQLAEGYMLGVRGPSRFEPDKVPATYFLYDLKTHTRTDFDTKPALYNAAAARGVKLALEPSGDFYFRYRWTWFDGLAFFALIATPLVAGVFLMLWVLRLRRSVVIAAG